MLLSTCCSAPRGKNYEMHVIPVCSTGADLSSELGVFELLAGDSVKPRPFESVPVPE